MLVTSLDPLSYLVQVKRTGETRERFSPCAAPSSGVSLNCWRSVLPSAVGVARKKARGRRATAWSQREDQQRLT
jgi:hypothetical protein